MKEGLVFFEFRKNQGLPCLHNEIFSFYFNKIFMKFYIIKKISFHVWNPIESWSNSVFNESFLFLLSNGDSSPFLFLHEVGLLALFWIWAELRTPLFPSCAVWTSSYFYDFWALARSNWPFAVFLFFLQIYFLFHLIIGFIPF
jgi:hypothetical protein